MKVLNPTNKHHGYQYKIGLNVLDTKFNDNPKESCAPGGFYFTTQKHIPDYYSFGTKVHQIFLPFNDPDFRMVKDGNDEKFRANKIILGEKEYSLFESLTYELFGWNMQKNIFLFDFASEYGMTDELEKLKNHCLAMGWYQKLANGKIKVGLTYSDLTMDVASAKGYIHVLNWWKESGLELQYSYHSMNWASEHGHINVLQWWRNSGLIKDPGLRSKI